MWVGCTVSPLNSSAFQGHPRTAEGAVARDVLILSKVRKGISTMEWKDGANLVRKIGV